MKIEILPARFGSFKWITVSVLSNFCSHSNLADPAFNLVHNTKSCSVIFLTGVISHFKLAFYNNVHEVIQLKINSRGKKNLIKNPVMTPSRLAAASLLISETF